MNRYRPTLTILLILLVLALLLTWPLPLHLTTHAPGDGSDDPAILWNLWWVRFATTELGQSPFQSAWMFWPIGIDLVFYTLTTLNGLLSIPIQLVLGVVPANSFVVYFELIIAALGMWLFIRWVLAQHPDAVPFSRRMRDGLALLGAVIYAFSSSKWLYLSLGQFNIAASHWLPWAMLYLARMWFARDWRQGAREAALCALFVLFTGWTEFTYASFFIQFALLFWLWHVVVGDLRQGNWENARRYTLLCLLLALLFLAGMAPILITMVQEMRRSGDFLVEGLGFANVFSNDLIGFFLPGNQHPLLGPWVSSNFELSYLNFAFLGWVTLLLALLALLHPATRRYTTMWALGAALFSLLSLGPTLRINGREWELPLPFDLMLQLPLFKANRYPSRYSVIIMFCLAVLVSLGASALLQFLRARRLSRYQPTILAGLLALLLFEHLGAPLPLSDYRAPAIYEQAKGRAGEALLELPLAWRNGFRVTGTLHNSFMFAQAFQTTHEKRLLSGNTSRNPAFKFQYFTELPFINSLLAIETGHELPQGRAARDAAIAAEMLRLLDTPNIIVRRLALDQPFPVFPEATLPYLEQILTTRRWYDEAGYVGLEATLPAPPERIEWDGSHPLARLFFAEGWSALPPLDQSLGPGAAWPLYAQQQEARLLLPALASEQDWLLTLDSWLPAGLATSVELFARDPAGGPLFPLATLQLRGEQQHRVTIPAEAPRGSLTELLFRFDRRHAAAPFLEQPTAIGATGVELPFSLLVESAGLEVGDLAHIYLNGIDLAPGGTGYQAALISPEGEPLARGHFDTFNNQEASQELARLIQQAPPGTIIALAAQDTVSATEGTAGERLGDELVAALMEAGASPASDMRGRFRWSHAFIGVKGAPPGTALEDSSPIRPARVVVGPPLQDERVAVRLDRFRLEPAE